MKLNKVQTEKKGLRLLSNAFFILALLCAVYFFVIIAYAGIGTAYCFVWLFFTALFALMAHFIRVGAVNKDGMPRFVPTFVFTTFILFALIFVLIMSAVIRYAKQNTDEYTQTDYTIVLGARVYSNGVSKTLMYRLERALDYYYVHPETTLVLTGGFDTGDVIPEALAMFNYFSMNGVPTERMLIDTSGTNTVSIIEGAVDRIAADVERRKYPDGPDPKRWSEDRVPTVGIITSDYHMMRAVKVAENQGIEDPIALPARSDNVLFLHQCVRESAAIVKDYLMGNFTLNERELSFN